MLFNQLIASPLFIINFDFHYLNFAIIAFIINFNFKIITVIRLIINFFLSLIHFSFF